MLTFQMHDVVEFLDHKFVVVAEFVNLKGEAHYVLETGEGRLQVRSQLYASTRFKLIERGT